MGVPLIQSIALPAMLLFSLIIIPQLALGGITRHYHFDVHFNKTLYHYSLLLNKKFAFHILLVYLAMSVAFFV